MSAWPALENLVWLFEVAPEKPLDPLGYPTVEATFVTTRGETTVECTIEPYRNSITIRSTEGGEERLVLHLWDIVDEVRVDRDRRSEALVVSMIAEVPFHDLRLQLEADSAGHLGVGRSVGGRPVVTARELPVGATPARGCRLPAAALAGERDRRLRTGG